MNTKGLKNKNILGGNLLLYLPILGGGGQLDDSFSLEPGLPPNSEGPYGKLGLVKKFTMTLFQLTGKQIQQGIVLLLNQAKKDTCVPHADDNRIGPCRVQQQRGSRDHQYQ